MKGFNNINQRSVLNSESLYSCEHIEIGGDLPRIIAEDDGTMTLMPVVNNIENQPQKQARSSIMNMLLKHNTGFNNIGGFKELAMALSTILDTCGKQRNEKHVNALVDLISKHGTEVLEDNRLPELLAETWQNTYDMSIATGFINELSSIADKFDDEYQRSLGRLIVLFALKTNSQIQFQPMLKKVIHDEFQKINDSYHESFKQAREMWEARWSDVVYCIENNLSLFILGKVQLGKTIPAMTLMDMALHGFTKSDGTVVPKLVDFVWFNTSCNTGLMGQNFDRLTGEFLEFILHKDICPDTFKESFILGTDSKDINSKTRLSPGRIYVSLNTAARWTRLEQLLRQSPQHKTWRGLLMLDEADSSDPNLGFLLQDTRVAYINALKRLVENSGKGPSPEGNYLLSLCYISATMVSVIGTEMTLRGIEYEAKKQSLLSFENNDDNDDIEIDDAVIISEQVFCLDISPYYKGFVNSNGEINKSFINSTLLDDEEYDERKYEEPSFGFPRMGLHNTKNPQRIADNILASWANDGQTQVSVLNMGARIEIQQRPLARLLGLAFNNRNEKVCFFMSMDDIVNNPNATVYNCLYNSTDYEVSKFGFDEILKKIADVKRGSDTPLKAVNFILSKMGDRGNTVSIGIRDRIKDPHYRYMYCNKVFALGSDLPNIQQIIQWARNSGIHTSQKTHEFYCLDVIKQAIIGYFNLEKSILDTLDKNEEITVSDVLPYDIQHAVLGDVNSRACQPISKTFGKTVVLSSKLDKSEVDAIVNNGYPYNGNRIDAVMCDHWMVLDPTNPQHKDAMSTDISVAEAAAEAIVISKGWHNHKYKIGRVTSQWASTRPTKKHPTGTNWIPVVNTKKSKSTNEVRKFMQNAGHKWRKALESGINGNQQYAHLITIFQADDTGEIILFYNKPLELNKANITTMIELGDTYYPNSNNHHGNTGRMILSPNRHGQKYRVSTPTDSDLIGSGFGVPNANITEK